MTDTFHYERKKNYVLRDVFNIFVRIHLFVNEQIQFE
jgi:hypothetical protein